MTVLIAGAVQDGTEKRTENTAAGTDKAISQVSLARVHTASAHN